MKLAQSEALANEAKLIVRPSKVSLNLIDLRKKNKLTPENCFVHQKSLFITTKKKCHENCLDYTVDMFHRFFEKNYSLYRL